MDLVKPKKLKKGDTIGIVAPSGFGERSEIDQAAQALQGYGFQVRVHPQCYERDFVSAGSVERRLQGLHEFFADPTIDAIFAMRGGLRSMQLLEKIDYDLVRANPKIFIGYSDVSFILSALNEMNDMVTFHGLTLSRYLSDKPKDDQEKTLSFLQGGDLPWDDAGEGIVPGEGIGELVGGNLSLVHSMLAFKDDLRPTINGKIVMLEEIGEEIRQIDRMFATLKLASVFDEMAGMVIGQIADIRDGGDTYKFNCTVRDVIREYVADCGKPVTFGAPFGHDKPNLPFPIGIKAHLVVPETGKAQLTLLESPFAD